MADNAIKEKEESSEREPLSSSTEKKRSSKKIPFWTENPNVLFEAMEFFPVETMTYAQKLNSITRVVIVVSVLLFLLTRNATIFLVFLVTMGAIAMVYYNHTPAKKSVRFSLDENFEDRSEGLAKHTLKSENKYINPNLFDDSKPTNPFSNVLLTDYEYNPNKKPAPASYNRANTQDILTQAKEFVKTANPDQPDIADKLFKDLGEELQFEQSMRPFYSTPATTVPNDQQAFADFCYGSMISCKEGNMFACSRKYQTANN